MKKVVLAVVLLAVGMGLALAILPSMGFHFGFLDAYHTDQTSYTVTEAFDAIDIQSADCDVSISTSYDDRCSVSICQRKDAGRSVRVEDGVLTVRADGKPRWFEKLGMDSMDQYMIIYLPAGSCGPLTVHTDSGEIYVSGDNYNGEGLRFAQVEMTTGSGYISCYDTPVDGELTLETDSGEVHISDSQAEALTIRTDSGDVTMDTVTASGPVEITAGSGEIWMWDSDGASFRITADSGDVSGDVLTPKNFSASTGSGSVTVPRADKSAGEFAVTTGSGDIYITLSETDPEEE